MARPDKDLAQLEHQVEGLRLRRSENAQDDARKVLDEVFDRRTMMAIYKFMKAGVIDTVDFPISTGKEGNVFRVTDPEGDLIAMKIYRVSNSTFHNIAKYIEGDPRFRGMQGSHFKMIMAWATKEFKNLTRLKEAGVRVPEAIDFHQNILLMEYLGDADMPAPQIRNVQLEHPEVVYREIRPVHEARLPKGPPGARRPERVQHPLARRQALDHRLRPGHGRGPSQPHGLPAPGRGQHQPLFPLARRKDKERGGNPPSRRRCEEMKAVRIPQERVGVLIGRDGATKAYIERRAKVRLIVDKEGEVTVDESKMEDPVMQLKIVDVIKAIGRGFSPHHAYRLFDDDEYLEIIDIDAYVGKKGEHLMRVRARLIGSGGKTRHLIEDLTGANMSVYGDTVGLIGNSVQLPIARNAVDMLLRGSEHSTVYRYLERSRAGLKIAEMGFE